MENVTPTLVLLWDVKRSLEMGTSVSKGIKNFLNRGIRHEFSHFVNKWVSQFQSQEQAISTSHLPATRRHLLALLEQGLKGQSILEPLKSFEAEIILSCEEEVQNHLAKLPLLLMIPLMGLIFPALMVLIVGPTLKMLQL